MTLTADADYFASLRPAATELWLTLNRDLSGATNHVEIAAGAAGSAPSSLVAAATSSSQVGLSWSAAANALRYEIWRANVATDAYTLVNTIAGTASTDSGLAAKVK